MAGEARVEIVRAALIDAEEHKGRQAARRPRSIAPARILAGGLKRLRQLNVWYIHLGRTAQQWHRCGWLEDWQPFLRRSCHGSFPAEDKLLAPVHIWQRTRRLRSLRSRWRCLWSQRREEHDGADRQEEQDDGKDAHASCQPRAAAGGDGATNRSARPWQSMTWLDDVAGFV